VAADACVTTDACAVSGVVVFVTVPSVVVVGLAAGASLAVKVVLGPAGVVGLGAGRG
jgi:hypothetical protein